MNHSVYSAECLHRLHSACHYEDCACLCHIAEMLFAEESEPLEDSV